MNTSGITTTASTPTPSESFSADPPLSQSPSLPHVSLPELRKKTPPFLFALGVIGLMWLFLAIIAFSDAGWGILVPQLVVGGGALGILWLGAVCYYMDELHSWKAKAWTTVVPLAGMLGFVLACTDADLALRVWLCESSLKQYAATAPPEPKEMHDGEWVGLFRVDGMVKDQGAFALYTSAQGMMDRAGIAYIPPGSPLLRGVRVKQHLYGNWYTFWSKF